MEGRGRGHGSCLRLSEAEVVWVGDNERRVRQSAIESWDVRDAERMFGQ